MNNLVKEQHDIIMSGIFDCYIKLSPENLTCDGELPKREIAKRETKLNDKLNYYFKVLGRVVSEEESYTWNMARFVYKPTVAINDFVLRQTKESEFSYFDGTWDELLKLVTDNMFNASQGYKEGVMIVPVPADGFYTSFIQITDKTKLVAKFKKRRVYELPYIQVHAKNTSSGKLPAKYVKIILYRNDVLAETGENTTDSDWEIISINASLKEKEPMHPMAMARNMLGLEGGTSATYTGEEFAKAIIYWSDKVNIEAVDPKK